MRVLIGCEFSGVVRESFRARGFDAYSCDILPAEDGSPFHLQCDVRDVLADDWTLGIFHPPCTYMTNSGVCHLHTDETRWAKLDEAAAFFRALWDSPVPRVAIENPVMHRYAKERIGGLQQAQTIQPYHFGHLEQKATCLWLRGVPKLRHVTDLKAETKALPANQRQRLHYLPPSEDRWKLRSTTYSGIAAAMAKQWGDYLNSIRADLSPARGRSGLSSAAAAHSVSRPFHASHCPRD